MLGGNVSPAQLVPFRAASIMQRTVVQGGRLVVVVEGTGIVVGVVPMVVLVVDDVEPMLVLVVVDDVAPAVVVVVDVPPSLVVVLVVVVAVVVVVVEPGLQTATPSRPSARSNWNATWPLALMPMCFRPSRVSGANLTPPMVLPSRGS